MKLATTNEGLPSSPDSSSDSSPPPTPHLGDGPMLEAEQLLPGVVSGLSALPTTTVLVRLFLAIFFNH